MISTEINVNRNKNHITANPPAMAIDPEQLKAVIQAIVADTLAEEAAKNELAQNASENSAAGQRVGSSTCLSRGPRN